MATWNFKSISGAILTFHLLLAMSPTSSAYSFPRAESSLNHDWALDGSITLAAGAIWLVSELEKEHLAPLHCRWCAQNRLDLSVSNSLSWDNPNAAANMGNVALVTMPLALAGISIFSASQEGRVGQIPVDLLLVAQAVSFSGLTSQVVKFSVGRERPFVSELQGSASNTPDPADNNLSFYSQHTNLAFTVVVAYGTVARIRGYRAEPWIWVVGLPTAGLIGYSRIAAHKHYLSDVLVGAAMGSALGWLIPWLHTRQTWPLETSIQAGPRGLAIHGTF